MTFRPTSPDATDSALMHMLQELLKDRLHLSAHIDTEQRPVLALTQDKGGSRMLLDGAGYDLPPTRPG